MLWKDLTMNQQILHPDEINTLLSEVQEDMPVYDLVGQKMGTVKHIQFADNTSDEFVVVEDRPVEDAPAPVKIRLLRRGYIRVEGGFLRPTYYATADQIATVMADSVQLDVSREELLKL